LESALSLEEATTRLERELVPPAVKAEWRRPMEYRAFEKRPQSFIGTFAHGRFHMVRLVRGRGSNRPWIDGQLSRTVNGCRVDVRLKVPRFAIVVCIPFAVLGLLALLLGGFFGLWGLAVIAAPAIGWNIEARKAENLLAALFESKPLRVEGTTRPTSV
jgi:hypothetical protein